MPLPSQPVKEANDRNNPPHGKPGQGKPGLSPRQRQILELMRDGKANKEIARELGIGVGTVKQHVVALFKRLNVRNRAMAVSQAMELLEAERRPAAELAAEGLLVRRPCLVLGIALPAATGAAAERRLHRLLAEIAYDADALSLQRDGRSGELLFGIKRPSEHDLMVALHAAVRLHDELRGAADGGGGPAGVRAVLATGMAVVSRRRFGGWSGEAVATPVVAEARRTLEACAAGEIHFGVTARELMRSFGLGGGKPLPECLPLAELAGLRRDGESPGEGLPLLGRESARHLLSTHLARPEGALLVVEGETGMGKTRLCRAALELARESRPAAAFGVVPGRFERPLWDRRSGASLGPAELAPAAGGHGLVVVDDFHLLAGEARARVMELAAGWVAHGAVVLLAGRRVRETGPLEPAARLHLGRLEEGETRALIAALHGDGEGAGEEAAAWAAEAAGVPLFAVELARRGGELSPALLMTVAARLDGFELDWKLLYALARRAGEAATPADLAAALGEPVERLQVSLARAAEVGVVNLGVAGEAAFRHPLIGRVIERLGVE